MKRLVNEILALASSLCRAQPSRGDRAELFCSVQPEREDLSIGRRPRSERCKHLNLDVGLVALFSRTSHLGAVL